LQRLLLEALWEEKRLSAVIFLSGNQDFWQRTSPLARSRGSFSERISVNAGLILLVPLILAGAASAVYWVLSEKGGGGDLRPYIIVHYYPLALVPLSMALFPSRYTRKADIGIAILFYALAKTAEMGDQQIFACGVLNFTQHRLSFLFFASVQKNRGFHFGQVMRGPLSYTVGRTGDQNYLIFDRFHDILLTIL
jgi:hypothetical protein